MQALQNLDQMLEVVRLLTPDVRASVAKELSATLPAWVPNPGPQDLARVCEADELFYGGQAGGGKTDLVIGEALTDHHKSIVFRRYEKDVLPLADRLLDEVLLSRNGWNGQNKIWRGRGGKTIEFSGCQEEKDKQRWKGRPHDLYCFDEISDFLESQYRFIIGWNRTTRKGQRCRVICTGNPPTESSGLWVIKYWGPWLDPTHPRPAKDGELRWYTTVNGQDTEVDGPGPHLLPGESEPIRARSRTFIRAKLSDNPDLVRDGSYAATLAALPKELRAAYRDGNFSASMKDNPWQVIPTAWIMAAQARWTSQPPTGIPMCAMGVDVAQGGSDNNTIAQRYDGWYGEIVVVPGALTPLGGPTIAGSVIANRRDKAEVVVDCGGGYGGQVFAHLKENGVTVHAYKGAEKSERRTEDGTLHFANKRTEVYWRFREALDPDQPGGSRIMLPPDTELLSDLAAPTFEVRQNGIVVEPKDKLVERLGRSPDRGDAVVMAWSTGDKMENAFQSWKLNSHTRVKVIRSHASARRRR